VGAKEAQHAGLRRQDRAVQAATARGPEHRFLASQLQQITVQRIQPGVALSLGQIKLRARKRLWGDGVNQPRLHLRLSQARKLAERRGASFRGQPGEVPMKIRKLEKRAGGGEFLPLEEHRCARP
jgi:hypothetical protein